jgi:E3 SUMO-protein ligase RanBP2
MTSRLDALRSLVARSPQNAAARFGLATELLKAELWDEAREQLEAYLAMHDDEGNAWGKLADACEKLDRPEDAQAALRKGIEASQRHGHPGMAAEFEERLSEA